ncbi:serine/threonine-protein kinase [Sandaracinus amylolyticus]|uniref:serine/threonine-protein kinase n=1 Tax=Sandaracinus amylolyticus TaxID=927083 RepID=UPI001F436969|nr:serine/threonine-protein kinase [Sandaracinus amylolyticus]UJR78790.1 Serine/threonine protein kinase [Sandaracinus amylolyticus]
MTAAPASLLRDLSGRRLGRYEVLVQLASGGMATVYVARAQGVAGFERLVAIKVLHPHLAHDEEFISMFLDEARLAARIRHPNVVPTLDISDTEGDGYFLVMEYIEGDHLGALLREAARAHTPIPPSIAARLVIDALEGLGAAHTLTDQDGHALGIVHRDVSPHNVLIGSDGVARITDFGVAKAEVRLSSTRDGQFKGKLSYMAPEQASSGRADQRSDLFSMGIVLWETLTGRRLFRADNNGELLNRLLNEAIVPPSTYVPEAAAFDAICARALERDSDARFQTADEFVQAIEDAAVACGGVASPRAVGRLVRELLGPKIDAQNARIRAATDTLGRAEMRGGLLPLPGPGGSQPSQPSSNRPASLTPSAVRPIVLDAGEMTMGAKPSTLASEVSGEQPAPRRSRSMAWVVALLVLLVIGGVGAAFALGLVGGVPAVTATPVVATPPSSVSVPPVAEPAAPAAIAPEVTAPAVADTAPEPTSAEPAVAAEPARSDEASSSERRESESAREARRRRRAEAEAAAAAPSDDEDDGDLIVNPYRR